MALLLQITVGLAVAAIMAACVVLVIAALIHLNPSARPTLRRQSLVMLLTVLVASIFHNVSILTNRVLLNHLRLCIVSSTVNIFMGHFQHFVVMLIAVNLQLTVVHNISTVGWAPYYIGGSFIVALIIIVPGSVAKTWGPDPVIGLCYMVVRDPHQRQSWSLGSLHVWTLLSAAISLFSTIVVLIKLVATSQKVNRAFNNSRKDECVLSQQKILRSVTLRILPHPVYLVISNIFVVILDFHISLHRFNETLTAMLIFFIETPPLFFACVVLFFDPSLSAAIRQFFRKTPTILGVTYTNAHDLLENIPVELPTAIESSSSHTSLAQTKTNAEQDVLGTSSKPVASYRSNTADVRLTSISISAARQQVSVSEAAESMSRLDAETHDATGMLRRGKMDIAAL